MTAGRHNLSRRAVLGACFGVPALLGPSPSPARGRLPAAVSSPDSPVPSPDPRWNRTLAGFRRAEARLASFQAEVALLPPEARAFPAAIPLDDRFDAFEGARLAALRRLLRAPAPDLAGLSLKLDLAIADRAWELAGAEPCLAALAADARRLAREG